MAFLPVSYNTRSLFVRRGATLLTILSIAATVVVVAGVLALQQGFSTLFSQAGHDDMAIFLRPGSTTESDSFIPLQRTELLTKELPEILERDGQRMASAECYQAIRMRKIDGGETNVPIRGVQMTSLDIHGESIRIEEGARFQPDHDQIIVGRSLTRRIEGCEIGSSIVLNTTAFEVVGVFENEGPYASEIWGSLGRIAQALGLQDPDGRITANRVIALVKPGTDMKAFAKKLEDYATLPTKVLSEKQYLTGQTNALSTVLMMLGTFLGVVMGLAAIFTGTNTMLSALSARTHEIGILLAIGFRPLAIFVAFLLEAVFLGLLGGLLGCALTLPLNGIQTGTTNWQTFTEIAFAFRVTPYVLLTSVCFAVVLGLVGGLWPAWRAAHLEPTEALRTR